MNQGKVTYWLRIDEYTWSGCTEVEKRAEEFNFTSLTMHEALKLTYRLRIDECTWSGYITSGRDFTNHSPELEC